MGKINIDPQAVDEIEKEYVALQRVGAVTVLVSKLLLALKCSASIFGYPVSWLVAACGYVLARHYNVKKGNVPILVVLTTGLIPLTLYGGWKYINGIEKELHTFEYIILTVVGIFCLKLARKIYKERGDLWLIQIAAAICIITAFTLLGLGIEYGWIAMFLAHCCLGYIYYGIKGKTFVVLQIASIGIALYRIVTLLF